MSKIDLKINRCETFINTNNFLGSGHNYTHKVWFSTMNNIDPAKIEIHEGKTDSYTKEEIEKAFIKWETLQRCEPNEIMTEDEVRELSVKETAKLMVETLVNYIEE